MIRAVRSSKAIPISTGRVNRRDAIMTGRFACRGEEGREGKIGARQALWRAQIRWICACEAYPRSARSPTDLSGIPVSDITRAIEWRGYPDNGSFRGGNGGKKNDLWWSYLFYIYIVCFFLARSIRVLELEFIPRWTWNDSNRINRICI